jgi:hypothetical protein
MPKVLAAQVSARVGKPSSGPTSLVEDDPTAHDEFMESQGRARQCDVPLRPILVGVGGSAPGDTALRWAAHEAFLRGVGLRVLHIFAGARRAH